MKRIIITALTATILFCLLELPAYSWIFVDTSGVPGIPLPGLLSVVSDLDNVVGRNFRNYPEAFAMANVGGYPIGDAYLGKFPHMFFGASVAIGCANMEYYNEAIPREESVYPAYAPNPALSFGFGLTGGFDILAKVMILSDAMWKPPLNEKTAKLSKFNIYSFGGKIRKNLIKKKSILPYLLGFGGFTISAGVDYMEGIMGINGEYKHNIGNVFINPPGGYFNLDFTAYYNFNLKWRMLAANAQAIVYFDFLWLFDIYAGLGMALTWGSTNLEGSGIGYVTNPLLGTPSGSPLGLIRAKASYSGHPRGFMGLLIAGLEINLWILKISLESMLNISNGEDINVQVGTRFQF
ncbi:MAG: hypothetical protein JW807_05005 [Spirochaetes bacterium]|nr:hypothetical protein [Spirochaetota bacterium]